MSEEIEKSLLNTQTNILAKCLRGLNRFNCILLALSGSALFLSMTAVVVMRYLLNIDLQAIDEYIVFIAMWMIFLGATNGTFEKSHIVADTISTLAKNKTVLLVNSVIQQVITLFLYAAFFYYSVIFIQGSIALPTKTAVHFLPYLIGHSAILYSSVMMLLYQIYHFYEFIVSLKQRKPIKPRSQEQ